MKKPDQLYRVKPYARIQAVGASVERERAIRLYCEQMGSVWNLQIRAPQTRRDGREGKDFLVANAGLSVDDMRALRDKIDELLKYDEVESAVTALREAGTLIHDVEWIASGDYGPGALVEYVNERLMMGRKP